MTRQNKWYLDFTPIQNTVDRTRLSSPLKENLHSTLKNGCHFALLARNLRRKTGVKDADGEHGKDLQRQIDDINNVKEVKPQQPQV